VIEKILRLQKKFEPKPLVRPNDVAGELAQAPPPERPFRRVILYSPAFGESQPGEDFPHWLIPAKMRPPDCPEWKEFARVRSELTEEELLDDDPFSRCLRPCLRDPRRLALLIARRDLMPSQLDNIKDGAQIELLSKRRDLYPADLRKMGRKIRSALMGRVPPNALNTKAAALTRQAMGALGRRPDLRPEHLSSMIETMAKQTEHKPEVDLPKLFSSGLKHLCRHTGSSIAEARQKSQANHGIPASQSQDKATTA